VSKRIQMCVSSLTVHPNIRKSDI